MIVAILLYGTAVSLFLGLAGVLMEQLAARLKWPRRVVWAVTLFMSIAVPIAMVVKPHTTGLRVPQLQIVELPTEVRSHQQSDLVPASAPAPIEIRPQVADLVPHASPGLDRIVAVLWVGLSMAVARALGLSWIRLRQSRQQWRQVRMDGHQFWVTPSLGPAVLGFVRPQILLPQWLIDAPLAASRGVVIAHEREHIEARDPLLLLFGYLAVVLVPWNLPVWWQVRRFRFAVEVDCDARVLRKGTALQVYGEVLLTVGQRGVLAPLGTMAIAKSLSQLERRVRIMALPPFPPARWLIGLVAALAVACVVCALDLPPPALSDPVLRKSPLHDWSPFLPKAEAAARAAYPDLFAGHLEETVALSVDLNRKGEILGIHKQTYPPGFLPEQSSPEYGHLEFSAGMDHAGAVAIGRKFIGWFGPQEAYGLYLFYEVLKWPHDPERSAARVRDAVATQYPQYFRPAVAQDAPLTDPRTAKIVTVFMNNDGTINRAQLSEVGPDDLNERKFYDRFIALGLSPEEFGHRGRTFNSQNPLSVSRYPNALSLEILYAWPRRADDPPDTVAESNAVFREVDVKWSREVESQLPDDVFLKRYFPDIWTNAPATVSDKLWILFDRQGEVCDTGRLPQNITEMEQQTLFNARYPNARIRFSYGSGAQTANGHNTDLNYFWLDDDSKVKECAALGQGLSRPPARATLPFRAVAVSTGHGARSLIGVTSR